MEKAKIVNYDENTKIIHTMVYNFDVPKPGLGFYLYESLKKNLDKIAQIDLETGETDSFQNLLERSVKCAVSMRSFGLKPGDVISICSHNQFDCSTSFVASTFLGVINASLDPTLSLTDTKYLLELTSPKLIFVSKEREDLIGKIIIDLQLTTKVVVYGETDKFTNFLEFTKVDSTESTFKPYIPHDLNNTILIMFSSGTTGLPKGICVDHNFILYHTHYLENRVIFNLATLYWISSTMSLIATIIHGHTRAMCKDINHKMLWEQIEQYKIDFMIVPPFQAIKFAECRPKNHISSLKRLIIGGSNTTEENMLKIRAALPKTNVVVSYAITEAYNITYPYNDVSYKKATSVGLPLPNITYKVVDQETGHNLGFNEKGEILIKTTYSLKGYYKNNCSDIWDDDGFIKTGDIGYFDEDFCFYITNRIKEMFKYKGFHIQPVKLEAILLQHPEVEDAVIVGVPHSEEDNHILAVVVLKEKSNATSLDIETFYNERIDEINKIRVGVSFLDSIPRTVTGKINRKVVKDMILKKILTVEK